ncbi:REP-associated tyrosine transposase [Methylomarinum vadi]|uniref:REP-associated tyrosine transposase n=1 Tax=Methylomarinum vadi TaxID=438855 RepID=UPI00068D8910|nr:transposase [Methylomarinum vadi]
MTDIRRYPPDNQPVFITAVCHRRNPVLANDADKELLLTVMREVKAEMAFRVLAYVILDDHFHWLIRVDEKDALSRIIQSVKLRFSHRWKQARNIKTPTTLWQRRFWDHIIRNAEDLNRHMDYIHYNPVKHKIVTDPADYLWSSFHIHRSKGRYPEGWGKYFMPEDIKSMILE